MGFFQDLKEDLSQAVNELLPEEEAAAGDAQETVEDKDVDMSMKEVEEALMADMEEEEDVSIEEQLLLENELAKEDDSRETSENEEDSEKKENSENKENQEDSEPLEEADEEENAGEDMQDSEDEEEQVQEEENTARETEEAKAQPQAENTQGGSFQPVKDAAAAQLASIANIVAKEEPTFQESQNVDFADEYEERQLQSPEELLSAMEQQSEETELEKEVGKAMAEQKMNLEDEQVADETALITAGMTITGDIASKGSMEVLGKVTGNIAVLGKLNISGSIEGDSKAAEIFADSAHITGKITADGTVKIGQNSVIIGDIAASSAVIAGAVKGDIDVMGPVILDASAIVMGNIKSKSVQINNGAVIEGMCSQCYAEVNPTSFFDELVSK